MSKYDDIFKERFKNSFLKVAQNLLNEDFQEVKPLPIELRKQLKRKADFVFEVLQNKQKFLLHIEIQSEDDETMIERMYLYSALLFDKFKLPVKQIVFSLLEKSRMTYELDMGYFTYRYKLFSLFEVPYQHFLNSKETLVFAILGKYEPKNLSKVLTEIISSGKSQGMTHEELEELLLDLEILGKKRNLDENIRILTPMLMPFNLSLDDSPTFREAKKKAKIEGKLESQIEIAKAMLLDKLPFEQIAKYTKLPIEDIEKLANEL
jgi:predicted transposase/invertase (TIGR01784 family)